MKPYQILNHSLRCRLRQWTNYSKNLNSKVSTKRLACSQSNQSTLLSSQSLHTLKIPVCQSKHILKSINIMNRRRWATPHLTERVLAISKMYDRVMKCHRLCKTQKVIKTVKVSNLSRLRRNTSLIKNRKLEASIVKQSIIKSLNYRKCQHQNHETKTKLKA